MKNVVILKNGGMRAILMTSSLNLALKSADEQEAILLQFQNFLNSLEFSLQIFIQSRRLDIRPYVALLEERQKSQVEELIKIQTREYIEFIKKFTEATSIMTKNFFLIVPYDPPLIGKGGIPLPFAKKDNAEDAKNEIETFEENKSQLDQRISIVIQGLARTGLRTVRLGTEEIVEVYYKIFNPGETEKPIHAN